MAEAPPRRVLMVCYYFPPLGGIGSLRALKFAEHLPALGWEATVLAPSNGSYHRDASLRWEHVPTVRCFSLELSRLGKRLVAAGTSDAQPAQVGSVLGRIRDGVRNFLYRPDGQIGWYPMAVATGRRLLRGRRFDAVFSSSFPITAHLVARRLHRDLGLPWVADYRDPWAEVPGLAPRTARFRGKLEAALLTEADAVVTVSPVLQRLFAARGARRCEVITNGFDPEDITPPLATQGLVLTHLGSLYPGMQDLSVIWRALAVLRAERPELPLRLRFVGEIPREPVQAIRECGLGDCLELTGFLPHREALRRAASSSALLLGGAARLETTWRALLPGKMFEYLATGLPIVYIGESDTDAGDLLRSQPGCHLVAPGDLAGARQALLSVIGQPEVRRDLARFTRRALAGRLAGVLDEVSATRAATA